MCVYAYGLYRLKVNIQHGEACLFMVMGAEWKMTPTSSRAAECN